MDFSHPLNGSTQCNVFMRHLASCSSNVPWINSGFALYILTPITKQRITVVWHVHHQTSWKCFTETLLLTFHHRSSMSSSLFTVSVLLASSLFVVMRFTINIHQNFYFIHSLLSSAAFSSPYPAWYPSLCLFCFQVLLNYKSWIWKDDVVMFLSLARFTLCAVHYFLQVTKLLTMHPSEA